MQCFWAGICRTLQSPKFLSCVLRRETSLFPVSLKKVKFKIWHLNQKAPRARNAFMHWIWFSHVAAVTTSHRHCWITAQPKESSGGTAEQENGREEPALPWERSSESKEEEPVQHLPVPRRAFLKLHYTSTHISSSHPILVYFHHF